MYTVSWFLVSYRDKTDNAKCNPSLICMEKSFWLILNVKWDNTKNSSSQSNNKARTVRALLRSLSFCTLRKVSKKWFGLRLSVAFIYGTPKLRSFRVMWHQQCALLRAKLSDIKMIFVVNSKSILHCQRNNRT